MTVLRHGILVDRRAGFVRAQSASTLRRELARCKTALRAAAPHEVSELYGIRRSLEWALDENAMAPVRALLLRR